MCCAYFDKNPDVVQWSSESVIVKYKCPSDDEWHDYIIDFVVKFKSGKILLIEVKPKSQTILPKASSGKSKKTLLTEQLTFVKNREKWKAADTYAKEHNAQFVVWSEQTLKSLGMPIF
jgi:hypothetical protein